MQKLHAFLTHQSDADDRLVDRLQRTCRKTTENERSSLDIVGRRMQMAAPEHASTVTEVLMVIAVLRALCIDSVHLIAHCVVVSNAVDNRLSGLSSSICVFVFAMPAARADQRGGQRRWFGSGNRVRLGRPRCVGNDVKLPD
jgi:hypothetical protein